MPNWIECSGQMPDSETTVMTYAPESCEPIWPAYHDGEKWLDLNNCEFDGEVTHWMPFPEPPED